MRTTDEILHKIKARRDDPSTLFDFFPSVLMDFVSFDDARPFLDEEKIKEKGEEIARQAWNSTQQDLTQECVLDAMRDYMEFAWSKVRGHRGLSSARSVQKMEAYCWLMGREGEVDWEEYSMYGAPILRRLCELFGFPFPDDDWATRMAAGLPCEEDCQSGCL